MLVYDLSFSAFVFLSRASRAVNWKFFCLFSFSRAAILLLHRRTVREESVTPSEQGRRCGFAP